MKLVQVVDAPTTMLASDMKNRLIMHELVLSESSVTGLARKLDIPTVTMWKRIQKLVSAGLVEVSSTRRWGNLEKKMYRATAASYVPSQLLDFEPKDRRLLEAFEVYSDIQRMGMVMLTTDYAIPEDVNPADYALYANMRVFVDVCGAPDFQRKVVELGKKLAEYRVG